MRNTWRPGTKLALLAAAALLFGLPLAAAAQNGPPGGNPPGQGGPPPGQGGAPPGQGVPATATVQVDCAAGDSISDALETPALELTVEISGICQEDVVVRRDDVRLVGTDPALDGIRGLDPDAADPVNAVLTIDDSDRVQVEKLSIADGARLGVRVVQSIFFQMNDCVVENSLRDGVQAADDSFTWLTDVVLRGNGRSGYAGFDAEHVICTDCTIEDSANGILLIGGTRASIEGGSVTGDNFGALLFNGGSSIAFEDVDVAGDSWAVGVSDHASALITGGTLDGALLAEIHSSIRMTGAAQTNNPLGFNFIDANSSLNLEGGSSAMGYCAIDRFSQMTLADTSTLDGDLACNSGGDAFCVDPANVSGGSTCGLCPIP